jgi:hypothetical protein
MTKKKEEPPPALPRWSRNSALARYLNISGMCLWRSQRDPEIGFPQPSTIKGVRYTDLNRIDEWMRSRVVNFAKQRRSR